MCSPKAPSGGLSTRLHVELQDGPFLNRSICRCNCRYTHQWTLIWPSKIMFRNIRRCGNTWKVSKNCIYDPQLLKITHVQAKSLKIIWQTRKYRIQIIKGGLSYLIYKELLQMLQNKTNYPTVRRKKGWRDIKENWSSNLQDVQPHTWQMQNEHENGVTQRYSVSVPAQDEGNLSARQQGPG